MKKKSIKKKSIKNKSIKNKSIKKKLIIISSILLIIIILLVINNKLIGITNYNIKSKKIKKDIVIVQISDLHNTEFGSNQKKLIAKTKKIKPDIITITGDLIDSSKTNINIAMKYVKQAVKIAPTIYVSGNHEAWNASAYYDLKDKLKEAGVIILEDKVKELKIKSSKISVIGLSDPDFMSDLGVSNLDSLSTTLDSINYNTDNFVLLLSHRPEAYKSYENRDIDLVLTGHAHGGQFRIPFVGGVIAPGQGFFPEYDAGLYKSKKDNMKMIVSRGLGNSIIPLRINNNPEIVVVTIKHN